MIDASRFTRRFLRQFGLILAWLIFTTVINPTPRTPLAINLAIAIIGIGLLIGIIPGSYLSGLIDKISARAEKTSLNALILIALLMPILFATMHGFWAYNDYELLTSTLAEEALRDLNVRYDFGLNLIGFILPCILLIANIVFLIRTRKSNEINT